MRWEDGVAYRLLPAGVYFLVGILFFYAGKEKIFDGLGAPPGIEKQFAGTFLDTIPGVDAAWTILGILEFAIFVLVVISLVQLKFLAIGQNVTGENSGVAELYIYAGRPASCCFLVMQLPPYRAANRISGTGGAR